MTKVQIVREIKRLKIEWMIILIALGSVIATNDNAKASPKELSHPIAEVGSKVFVNIGALRCRNLEDLILFRRFFREENMAAMDAAADKCLPDTAAETSEEEATGQRAGVLEKRAPSAEAQCVREMGSAKCVWVLDSQVEIEEDRR
jgi:hypothetical protein